MATLPQVASPFPELQTPTTTIVNQLGQQSTIAVGLLNQSNNGFFGFIQMLQRNNILKVLAEPTLVTTSGRPAYFLSGGEMPIPVPQSLGTISIQFRKFGTQVDFVPIVLGSGRIHLEVRPKISEIDPTVSITLNGSTIPGFRTRECDTGVEMNAGQTLALAGLLQTDVQQQVQGIPYLMDIPYLGLAFRRSTETLEETELLIMVRPELAEGMNCEQVPPIGPGVSTMSPDDCGFYFKGYNEVPAPPMAPKGGPGGMGPMGPGNVFPQGAVPDSMEELPDAPAAKPRRTAPDGALPQPADGTSAGRCRREPTALSRGVLPQVPPGPVPPPGLIGLIVPQRKVRRFRPTQMWSASLQRSSARRAMT